MMKAVVYRVRSVLRRRLVATLGVTLIVTVVCGVVIAFAAGANRTSTAPDRYTSAFGGVADAQLIQDDRGKPLASQVAALPGVASVDSMSFLFGGLTDANGNDLDFPLTFVGSFRPSGLRLTDGRETDPANEHEFVATRNFVHQSKLKIGDELKLVTLTPEEARQNGYVLTDPQGPRLSIKMVGIVDGASQLDDGTPLIFISPALFAENIGLSESLMNVVLRPGVDLSTLRAELDADPALSALSVEPGTLISQPVRDAVQAQASGLWILAAVAAIAAVAVLGQVMTRQVRPTQEERERLSAIGFTHNQILAEASARAVIPITIGSLLGAMVAVLGSGRFPFGFVRVLEPYPGIRVDWLVVLGGAVLFVVALTLWTVGALALSGRQSRAVRRSPLVEALATRSGSATAGVGLRLAFSRRASERGSVRGSVAGVLLSVAGVVAAITFGVSLDRLVHEPARYGSNYDISIGDNGAESLPDGMVARLDANPDVASLTLFAGSQARVGDKTIPMLGLEAVRGGGQPVMLEGRLPSSDDEIAFGRVTAADIGAHVGDNVELAGSSQSRVFRVTGLAVVPGLGANDGLGSHRDDGRVDPNRFQRSRDGRRDESSGQPREVRCVHSRVGRLASQYRLHTRFDQERLARPRDPVRTRSRAGFAGSTDRGPRDVDIDAQSSSRPCHPSIARGRPRLDHPGRALAGNSSHCAPARRGDPGWLRHRTTRVRGFCRQHGRRA